MPLGLGEAQYCLSVLLHKKPFVKEERALPKSIGPLYDAWVTRKQAILSERSVSPHCRLGGYPAPEDHGLPLGPGHHVSDGFREPVTGKFTQEPETDCASG